jgi:hypothetical protein
MLNEEKIALMTKMAIYEKGEGRKSFSMSKYYRSDYMSLRIINSLIVTTLAYVIVVASIIFVNVEKLLDQLVEMDFLQIGKELLMAYGITLAVNLVMTYVIYRVRFQKYRKGLNEYNGNLKKLYHISKEESVKDTHVAGGLQNE